VKMDKKGVVLVLVHVDDMCIAAKTQELVNKIKAVIRTLFKVCDLGGIKIFLGMEVRWQANRDIMLTQVVYIEQTLRKYGLIEAKPKATLMVPRAKTVEARTDDGRHHTI
ncbi:hypothetical protein Vretimale_11653, partial [Volvox reticuliferus]